jgi:Cdc6-like AAA superfamily ATPase
MFHITENKLSQAITPLDNQLVKSDDPLPDSPGVIYLISGKKGTGKSTIILNLLKKKASPYYKTFDNIFLISPTAQRDSKFDKLCQELSEDDKCWDELSEEIIQNIIDRVQEFNDEWEAETDPKILKKRKGAKPNNLLILDDCIHMLPKSTTNSIVNRLFTTSRHLKLSIWVVTQKYNKINPLIRANADLISFFPSDNKKELQTLIDDINVDEKLFKQIYEFATDKPNTFMHVSLFGNKPNFFKKFDKINVAQ